MMMMRGWMVIAAVLLAACGGSGDSEPAGDGSDDSTRIAAASPAPAATRADSAVAAETGGDLPPGAVAEQDTGYTPWRPLEMPSEPWVQRAPSAQALLTRVRDVVAAQLEEPDASVLPTRMQLEQADSAVGILVHPDQADDSVRDVEFRLHMRREGAEWAVTAVDRRESCRRGVAAGGLCA
jgi:hypothetical protein